MSDKEQIECILNEKQIDLYNFLLIRFLKANPKYLKEYLYTFSSFEDDYWDPELNLVLDPNNEVVYKTKEIMRNYRITYSNNLFPYNDPDDANIVYGINGFFEKKLKNMKNE